MQQEQINSRRDPATAIADDLPVLIDPGCSKFRRSITKRGECLILRVDQACCRDIDAPRYTTWAAVAAWLQTLMELRPQRVDDHKLWILGRREHLVFADEPAGSRFGGEHSRWIPLGRTALDRTTLSQPFVENAIEHRSTIEAERFQHPPEPRGPHHGANAVQHDASALADAMTAECGLELLYRLAS